MFKTFVKYLIGKILNEKYFYVREHNFYLPGTIKEHNIYINVNVI